MNKAAVQSDYRDVIEFLRKRDYVFVRELRSGASGATVLLFDPEIKRQFVCKKYAPGAGRRKELFYQFVEEIRILHDLNHRNVVRVFNYYIYRDVFAGYLLMEFVDGDELEAFASRRPQDLESLFKQAIDGFCYLEEQNVLHRDIRSANLLVALDGTLKIIDFGFGKDVSRDFDFGNSVSLNWPVEPPLEFQEQRYDFRTEVYFLGMLFQGIASSLGLEFRHADLLRQMSVRDPSRRIGSFAEVRSKLSEARIEIEFSADEIEHYRAFSQALSDLITKIETSATYQSLEDATAAISSVYRRNMLESTVGNPAEVGRAFIKGGFFFQRRNAPYVSTLKRFVELLETATLRKRNIILDNVRSRLEGLEKYTDAPAMNDDIPF